MKDEETQQARDTTGSVKQENLAAWQAAFPASEPSCSSGGFRFMLLALLATTLAVPLCSRGQVLEHEFSMETPPPIPPMYFEPRFSTPLSGGPPVPLPGYLVTISFANAVAALGNDKVLLAERWTAFGQDSLSGHPIPLDGGGAVQLLDRQGNPITTFTNVLPSSVAAFGGDKVLIGTDHSAALYAADGTLLNSYDHLPALRWGTDHVTVAGVGTDQILVAQSGGFTTPLFDVDGGVYLMNLSGQILTTFTPPDEPVRFYRAAISTVGMDKVLIGSPFAAPFTPDLQAAGAAYLFDLRGQLLARFENPYFKDPSSSKTGLFGESVAAVGTNRVAIGGSAGVYLFALDGTLLTNVTATGSVATFGNDGFLVALGSQVRLYDRDGHLISTTELPSPETGLSLAITGAGTNEVLVGASWPGDPPRLPVGPGLTNDFAGAAYLLDFSFLSGPLAKPCLNIFDSGTMGMRLTVSTQPGAYYSIQATSDLQHWTTILTARATNTVFNWIDQSRANNAARFYRGLAQPSAGKPVTLSP